MENIVPYLKCLGFSIRDGERKSIYSKTYAIHEEYLIEIDLNKEENKKTKINFGSKIRSSRKTTQNFSQSENFVILECVNRLLEIGYSPEDIILEKAYSAGHRSNGQFLDILIEKDNTSFYMIECKTWGAEFEKEVRNIIDDLSGGQLFSYFSADRQVKKILIYTSTFENEQIRYQTKTIDTSDFEGSSDVDIHISWNKEFENIDILSIKPYQIISRGIFWGDLEKFHQGQKIYNGFARILRKYAVSDLSNAFNKLFNLFLCKIVDEDNAGDNNDYEMEFFWKKDETAYQIFEKLSKLYDKGMKDYLGFTQIHTYLKSDLEDKLNQINDITIRKQILKDFDAVRFQKNNEFSFIDVFDPKTFNENALIVKDLIKLLENTKIKGSDKETALGDFFERLLNIGIKQSEGQFFTPIPIANFIVNSIPLENIIERKIRNDDNYFLPYMIDYACGAGHFLTEYMHRINNIIIENDFSTKLKGRLQKDNYIIWKNNYKWAKEFVYGIDKDYRLTKTSKIACFLNGDGEANIISGNGLSPFDSALFSEHKMLKSLTMNNERFDCVIANPPYSVQDFKDTLKDEFKNPYGDNCFKLYKELGKKSDDIECLFLERTQQLLKENGYAGIIISNSILTNKGVHQKTRKLLLRNFKIKGIVELGTGAFMATGTNTIVLFMEKRKKEEISNVQSCLKKFYSSFEDFYFKDYKNIISKYASENYDILFEDYISLFKEHPSEKFLDTELFEDFYSEFISKLQKRKKINIDSQKEELIYYEKNKSKIILSKLIEVEKEKLESYLLNFGIKTVVSEPGKTANEISEFLGYKFTNRKGSEGISELKEDDSLSIEIDKLSVKSKMNSKLFNPKELLDPCKVNYYIYKNFSNNLDINDLEKIKINNLNENINYYDLNDLIVYSEILFNSYISMKSKKKKLITSNKEFIKLKKIENIDISSGDSAPQGNKYFNGGIYPFIRAETLNAIDGYNYIVPNKKNYITGSAIDECNLKLFNKNTILFPKSGQSVNTNNIGKLKEPSYVANHLATIYIPNEFITDYVFYILKYIGTSNLQDGISNYPTISNSSIKKLRIPFPEVKLIKLIVGEIRESEYRIGEINGKINLLKISLFRKEYFAYTKEKLKKLTILIKRGKTAKYGESNIQIIKSGQAKGLTEFDFSNKYYVERNFILDERKLQKNDLLINSTGVGTAGRVTLFNLFGDFVVDSHITIVRFDQSKMLPKYALYSLANIGFKNIEKLAMGQSGQKELAKEVIEKIEISKPNIGEQQIIVQKIESIEKEIEKLNLNLKDEIKKNELILNKYLN